MKYTLITSNGKVYTFFIKALAEQYRTAFGGVVFGQSIVQSTQADQRVIA